jgi:hypothetical protein
MAAFASCTEFAKLGFDRGSVTRDGNGLQFVGFFDELGIKFFYLILFLEIVKISWPNITEIVVEIVCGD